MGSRLRGSLLRGESPMNSLEALDFALHILRNRQRRVAPQPDGSSPTADAIETLDALRQLIADNER